MQLILETVNTLLDLLAEDGHSRGALTENDISFRTLADGIPALIWITDPGGQLAFVNRAYLNFIGMSIEQVRFTGWQALVHHEDRVGYTAAFDESLRQQQPFHMQGRVARADGEWRWIESRGLPRFSEEGEFLGVIGTAQDITESKRIEDSLRESEQRQAYLLMLSDALRSISDPVEIQEAVTHTAMKYFQTDRS